MLKDESPWVLAVDWGTDSAAGVLERSPLSAAWENDDKSVSLRGMQDEETTLRDNAEQGFEEERAGFKETLALPVTNIALVATAVGGFGYGALKDLNFRPWLVGLTVALLLLGIAASILGGYAKKTARVRLARIDLLQADTKPTRLQNLWRPFVIVAFLGAIVCGASAFIFQSGAGEPSVTIGSPDETVTEGGLTVEFAVTWKNLGESVKEVRTTVESGGKEVFSGREDKSADGTATEAVKFSLPGPGTIEVTTEALDASDKTVGRRRSEEREVETP